MKKSSVLSAVIGAVGALVLAIGCSSSGSSSSSSSSSSSGSPSTAGASKSIGAAGGSIAAPDGTTVDIPAGALASDTVITVAQDPSAPVPAEIAAAGTPIVLGPEGLKFDKPVKVTLTFAGGKIKSGRTAADLVVLSAPKGTTTFAPLTNVSVNGSTVSGETMHFSTFVPGTVECSTQCHGDDSGNCGCTSTCLGTDYSIDCPGGACTCQNGQKTSSGCNADALVAAFKDTCGYPGPKSGGNGGSSDAGTAQDGGSATDPCTIGCGGDSNGNCQCMTTCNGVAYAMNCPGGVCTCSQNGQKTSGAGTIACTGPSVCNDFKSICGFPGSCDAPPPTDAGIPGDSGTSNDSGDPCTPLGCSGGSGSSGQTTCQCSHTCSGTTYSLECTGTSCVCKTNGSPTKQVAGAGQCSEYTSCGTP